MRNFTLINLIIIFLRLASKIKHKFSTDDIKKRSITLERSYYHFEARKMGLNSEDLHSDITQISNERKKFNVWQSCTDFDGPGSLKIAGDKIYCYKILADLKIPLPAHIAVNWFDFSKAIAFWQDSDTPIVIKPAKDTGDSTGVSVKINSRFSIICAMVKAGLYCDQVLIEKYCQGINYRLLFCNGKFLACSARIPARVTGDGISSISALIDRSNHRREINGNFLPFLPETRPILNHIRKDKNLKSHLKRSGKRLSDIPDNEEVVSLADVCLWLSGGEFFDVTEHVDSQYIKIAQKSVDAIGIKLAGVDVIATDITKYRKTSFVINEVNTTPAILVHYEVMNQEKQKNAAEKILYTFFNG